MKRTNLKVKVRDGQQTIVRTVYIAKNGEHCFKHTGDIFYIRKYTEGRRVGKFYAMFFPEVEYIEEA